MIPGKSERGGLGWVSLPPERERGALDRGLGTREDRGACTLLTAQVRLEPTH